MDVLDMYRVSQGGGDRARAGEGPTLIEARTYRFVGHSMSDPVHGVYRTKEDVEEEKLNDPIRIYANLLADLDILSQEELEEMDEEVKRVSDESAEFAENSPEPEPASSTRHLRERGRARAPVLRRVRRGGRGRPSLLRHEGSLRSVITYGARR
jgi:TPP-dependent pyruvate/acetoin dehydrogenase alpha subunit